VFPNSLVLAYYRAFDECLMNVGELASDVGEIAEFAFDISAENEYNAALLYKTMREADSELSSGFIPTSGLFLGANQPE